ncbi:NAD-dependent malic enzyme [Mycobacterium sp. OTB74]|jgi:malate dehydrogenase (oxaloacetate-decarboxylating)|uniref:NAD-dependent malic enzyme n=1 Tax=Mycobacterium sp. OTB74 TaxID=1853452 RepID=UPI002475FAEE|nr:NAD-dependent malic enzyme [Mycobacterium sp. OTB74]MDH6245436.1 malate dehydrogenase (oxaloacetate-decarboxylating) [Mycobacterium sp. OTB74]
MSNSVVPRIPSPLTTPTINQGTAFTDEQRRTLGLVGRLPSAVLTLEQQAGRLWDQLCSLPNDLARNLLLEQMHNRNEVLYYKVLTEHLTELLPVVYDPTVGDAIEQYSDEYRGQRGIYLSIDSPEDMEAAFGTLGLGPDDVDLVVCSDAEEILGIGDWGVGGIQIAVGKLAIYTAGGGIDPSRTIPVSLDVGTDNQQLLGDPFYLGNKHARRRGADYDAFIKRYIETAHRLFPNALLHFEDFGPEHAHAILDKYSPDYRVFNDDVQGTGAVVMAAVYAAVKITRTALRDQRMVVFGSGTAGVGIADQLYDAMVADGAGHDDAVDRIWLVDKQGLLFDDMDDLRDFQRPYAKNRAALGVSADATFRLVDSIKMASPTILLGTSTVHGGFTREVIEAMTAATPRPVILPISNPSSRIEVMPADAIAWSKGAALVAAGIPVQPVEYGGVTHTFGQANNFMVFPGLGLGVIVAGATRVTKSMLVAAARAVAEQADVAAPGAALLPDVKNLRALSALVAQAVYAAAHSDGVATRTHGDVASTVEATMWRPEYRPVAP